MLKRIRDAIGVLLGRKQALPPAKPGPSGFVEFRAVLMSKQRVVRFVGMRGNHMQVEEAGRTGGWCGGLITENDVHPEDVHIFRQLKGN